MHISKIRIVDVKGFERVELDLARRNDDAVPGWTVFAGRNGSGKSTLLKCLALALRGPDHAYRLELSSMRNWVRHAAKKGGLIEVTVRTAPRDEESSSGRSTFKMGLQLERDGEYAKLKPIGRAAGESGPWASESGKGWLLAGYGAYRRLGQESSKEQSTSSPAVRSVLSLFRDDFSLWESEQWLRDEHYRQLEAESQGKEALPLLEDALGLLSDGLLPDGVTAERVDSDGLWVRQGKDSFRLEDMSDGYRAATALVMDLLHQVKLAFPRRRLCKGGRDQKPTVTCSGVVLIDEAENHLHPTWQRRIGVWLKDHFPNLQFLVTTHSPFVCQAADSGGLIRLADGTAEVVPDELFKTVVHGSADDAVVSEMFGLPQSHSDESEELREQVAALEAKQARGKISLSESRELKELLEQLPTGAGPQTERILRRLVS